MSQFIERAINSQGAMLLMETVCQIVPPFHGNLAKATQALLLQP